MPTYFELTKILREAQQGLTSACCSGTPPKPVEARILTYQDKVWVQISSDGLKIKVGTSDFFDIPQTQHGAIWDLLGANLGSTR
jgi:hypothetical protein